MFRRVADVEEILTGVRHHVPHMAKNGLSLLFCNNI